MLKVVISDSIFIPSSKNKSRNQRFTQTGKVDGQQFRVFFVKMGWYENEKPAEI